MSSKTAKQIIQDVLPPKRIYNWQQSQLSLAKYYGGITLNGAMYVVRYDLEGQPLEEVKPKSKLTKAKKRHGRDTKQRSVFTQSDQREDDQQAVHQGDETGN